MSDLLVRKVTPHMKRLLRERARANRRSLSDEAKILLEEALQKPPQDRKLGTELSNLVRPEDRGDDLVFEYSTPARQPPDFK